MGKFDSLLVSRTSKRTLNYDFNSFYRRGRFSESVDYAFFENENIKRLLELNKTKKYDTDLIRLWAKLDMKSYIDYDLGNTLNLYFTNYLKPVPVKKLENYNYMFDEQRYTNLLDIKYVKKLKIQNIQFDNLYFATYEIMDSNRLFRPYILLFRIDENNNFVNFGYGFDSNNDGNIELFIESFNYPLFLNTKGSLILPMINKKIKLDVYDYIQDSDIEKLVKTKKEY